MLRKTLISFFVLLIAALLFAWVLRGGPARIGEKVRALATPDITWGEGLNIFALKLPYQPENPIPTIEIGADGSLYGSDENGIGAEVADIEAQLSTLEERAREMRDFGAPSPYANAVDLLDAGGALSGSPSSEYIQLAASYGNTGDIPITGWSVQSAISGVRVYIPSGANPFLVGTLSQLSPITLEPGASAVVVSGFSPVGASFRENACTGYLTQFQTFEPSLVESCPAPESEMPLSAETARLYGGACIDFVRTLPECRFYTGFMPRDTSPSCAAFVGDVLSHNGCVARHRSDPEFGRGMWRVFLNAPTELWRNTHDVLRLLDAEGRVVDTLSY